MQVCASTHTVIVQGAHYMTMQYGAAVMNGNSISVRQQLNPTPFRSYLPWCTPSAQ